MVIANITETIRNAGAFSYATATPSQSNMAYWLALVAIVLSIPQPIWNIFGRFVTVFHELGHALAGSLFGRRLKSITISADMSGETHTRGKPGFGLIWTRWWGYPFPILYGLWFVYASYTKLANIALAVTTLLLIFMLLFVRNIHGASIIIFLLALDIASFLLPASLYRSYICLALGIALIIGSWRALINVTRVHYKFDKTSSDAYHLTQDTWLPGWFWFLTFYFTFIVLSFTAINIITNGWIIATIQHFLVSY
ncbi:MAG: M50 family metallopeptidase [Micrococcaceae bacterium]